MAVTIQDVEHVASLARLRFSDEEKETLRIQLNRILEYMEQLNRLDTASVEPLSRVVEISNVFREDRPAPGVSRNEALQNAPARTGEFFRVPKVISDR
jgi:aspartyl-tRNA(Asn)/glutamyl-tRNA(Gln) amidotransferase subunit C